MLSLRIDLLFSDIDTITTMAKENNTADINPNGFITEREVNGERRSVRHYNDGRISSRNNSRSNRRTISRTASSASINSTKKATFWDPSASSRASSATPSVVDGPETPDLSSAVEALTISEPTSKPQKICHPFEKDPEVDTVTLRTVTQLSRPASVWSNASIGSGNVHDRVANIETNIKKFGKTRLGSIAEEEKLLRRAGN